MPKLRFPWNRKFVFSTKAAPEKLPSITYAMRRSMLVAVTFTLLLATAWTIANAWIGAFFMQRGWSTAAMQGARHELKDLAREAQWWATARAQSGGRLAPRAGEQLLPVAALPRDFKRNSGFALMGSDLFYVHGLSQGGQALARPIRGEFLAQLTEIGATDWVLVWEGQVRLSSLRDADGRMLRPGMDAALLASLAASGPADNPSGSTRLRTPGYAGFLDVGGGRFGAGNSLETYYSFLPLPGLDGRPVAYLGSLVPKALIFLGVYKAAQGSVLVLAVLLLSAGLYAHRVARRYLQPLRQEVDRLQALCPDLGGTTESRTASTSELEALRHAVSRVEAGIRSERELGAQLEQERARSAFSSKMASLGEMASGVAHEINTPLAVISARSEQMAELLREREPDHAALEAMARVVTGTAQRIAKIVKGLRSFARDGSQEAPRDIRLRDLVDEVLVFCHERFRLHGVRLDLSPALDAPLLRCRPTEAMQVLLNLLNNAFDAVQDLPQPWVRLDAVREGSHVRITVTDRGAGIDPLVARKLFQPFFTTKEPGKGTGLGLSISRSIAESQGGSLELDPLHANTRFILTLPAAVAADLEADHGQRKHVSA